MDKAEQVFSGGGMARASCRSTDWASTPLGAVDVWPTSLRSVASFVLSHPLPALLLWGEARVQIFNDPYAEIWRRWIEDGAAHRPGDGRPTVWPLHDWIETRVRMGHAVVLNQQPVCDAPGAPSDGPMHRVSYSPVWDDDGKVGGVLVTGEEVPPERGSRANAGSREDDGLSAAFETLFHTTTSPCVVVSPQDYRVIAVNDAYVGALSTDHAQLMGRLLFDVLDRCQDSGASAVGALRASFDRVVAERCTVYLPANRLQVRPATGASSGADDRWWASCNVPVLGPRGEVIAIIHQAEDAAGHVPPDPAAGEIEQRHRLALEAARVGEWTYDVTHGTFYCSPRARAMHGLSADEPLTVALHDELIHPEDRAAVQAARAAAVDPATGGEYRVEFRLCPRGGGVRWFESVGRAVFDSTPDGPRAAQLLGAMIDVTARRRAEEALRTADARFRALVTASSDVLFQASADWSALTMLAGAGFLRPAGRSERDWLREYIPAADRPRVQQAIAEALGRRGIFDFEHRLIRDDGSEAWVVSRAVPLCDAAGNIDAWFGAASDITERKAAEAALRDSDERQRMALDAAELGTWTHDVHAGCFHLDARAQRHYAVDSPSTSVAEVIARIHPDDRPGLERVMEAALDPSTKAPVQAEYRVLRPGDATERWLAVNGRVHFAETARGERPVLAIGTTRDVTVQKEVEAALREADRRKDEFLAVLAHELRNPLAPIRSAAGILQRPGVPPAVLQQSREIIDRQVAHMTRLVDDLLDVSRLSRGKLLLKRRVLPLEQVLELAVETARPTIEALGHQLQQHPPGAVSVDGDLARLAQVFANLLNNAARYTPAGGTITIAVQDRAGAVEVSVTDTGQGIAHDRLERIFDLFTQGAEPTSVSSAGLGVGLALARQLVELHGGTITASSAGLGRGATFTVTLPVVSAAGASCERSAGETVRDHVRRRVLVVDDNVDAADTTATLLASAGCTVRAVYGGRQALDACASFSPEVVLLDIGMPELDGLEVCRRIRALPGGHALTLVALTGWGQVRDRQNTRAAGFDLHLVKPVAPHDLLDVVTAAGASGPADERGAEAPPHQGS